MSILVRKDSIIGRARKEKNSFYLITPKIYSKPHFINKYVFNLWLTSDKKTIPTIIDDYCKKYPDIPKKKIKKDIMKSLIYLNNLKMIDIIGEDKKMLDSSIKKGVSIVNERDFRTINDFIVKVFREGGTIINFSHEREFEFDTITKVYSIQAMRINQIHRQELYFKILNDEYKLVSVIGVVLLGNPKTCYINTIISEMVEEEELINIIQDMIKFLNDNGISFVKIRTSKIEDVHRFLKYNFYIEAKLENELNDSKTIYILRRDQK